jgi:nitrous oxidase accessory protein NosD
MVASRHAWLAAVLALVGLSSLALAAPSPSAPVREPIADGADLATGLADADVDRSLALEGLESVRSMPTMSTDGLEPVPEAGITAEDLDACSPHPPIEITEEVGPQGFILGEDPLTGEPIYRPGSGVVAGDGTEANPYVIEGWCIEATGNPQGIPTCIIVPGVERWCGEVPNDLVAAPNQAISIEGTEAHVVVRDNVVTGTGASSAPSAPGASGVVLDAVGNASVESNVAAATMSGIVVLDGHDVTVRDNDVALTVSSGVVTSGTDDVAVVDNRVGQAYRGLWILDADEATRVVGNEVTAATYEAIRVQLSQDALVRDNRVDGVQDNLAIHVDEASDLRIQGNALTGGGLVLTGDIQEHYVHDVEANLVNGQPLVYHHADRGLRIGEPVGQVVLVDTAGVRIDDVHVQDAAYGIHAVDSTSVHVTEATVEATRSGIVLDGTKAARVTDTAVHGAAPSAGILVTDARSTAIRNATVTGSGFDAGLFAAAGLTVTGSEGTRLIGNEASDNDGFGIGVYGGSLDAQLRDNEAHRNALHGLTVGSSLDAEVRDSHAASNEGFGIDVRGTGTDIETAQLAANAGGGLRVIEARNATVTRAAIAGPSSQPLEVQDEAVTGLAIWDTEDAQVADATVSGYDRGLGLYRANEDVDVHDSQVTANAVGVWAQGGLLGQPANLTLAANAIAGNTEEGLHAQDLAEPVDARGNWWGHASGPSGDVADACTGTVADGEGQAISTDGAEVCFDPWLDARP